MSSTRAQLSSLILICSGIFGIGNTQELSFPDPKGYVTTTFNVHATIATGSATIDFSNDALVGLWHQVGPIEPPRHTTTVMPTPEPSMFPGPGEFHPLVATHDTNLTGKLLPRDFVWGVASSAYQIEGAAREEGKGPSIWDLLSHRVKNFVNDNSTGDVAAEHYYLYKQDIARMKALGIKAFSPSISWPRIFPFGKGPVNEAGVKHYDDVMSELIKNGITPALTLFHWDTPLALFHEYGAWTDRRIVDDFFGYAKFIIQRYDRYVPVWYSINEPQYCNWQYAGYPAGKYYPAPNNVTGGNEARFLCGHYTLLAHAKVAKWYHEEFKGRGRISFKNSGNHIEPATQSPADIRSANRTYDFSVGWFGGPWTDGDYPASLKETLGNLLPKFTDAERAMIKGSCDFYAIDGYTSSMATSSPGDEACYKNSSAPGWPECAPSRQLAPNGFPMGPTSDKGASWLSNTPTGVRKLLKHLMVLFPTIPDIVVSEFGFAEPFESSLTSLDTILWDLRRADYYQGFLDNILASMLYDCVNITGAWGWAIFDNFEWNSGVSTRFGLQYLNYTDLTRTPKASMFQFLNWFEEHGGAKNESSRVS